jgi:hypothetical protein
MTLRFTAVPPSISPDHRHAARVHRPGGTAGTPEFLERRATAVYRVGRCQHADSQQVVSCVSSRTGRSEISPVASPRRPDRQGTSDGVDVRMRSRGAPADDQRTKPMVLVLRRSPPRSPVARAPRADAAAPGVRSARCGSRTCPGNGEHGELRCCDERDVHEWMIEFVEIDREGCMRMLAAASGGVGGALSVGWDRRRRSVRSTTRSTIERSRSSSARRWVLTCARVSAPALRRSRLTARIPWSGPGGA